MNCEKECSRVVRGVATRSSVSSIMEYIEYRLSELCSLHTPPGVNREGLMFFNSGDAVPTPLLRGKIKIGNTEQRRVGNVIILIFDHFLRRGMGTKSPLYNKVSLSRFQWEGFGVGTNIKNSNIAKELHHNGQCI